MLKCNNKKDNFDQQIAHKELVCWSKNTTGVVVGWWKSHFMPFCDTGCKILDPKNQLEHKFACQALIEFMMKNGMIITKIKKSF